MKRHYQSMLMATFLTLGASLCAGAAALANVSSRVYVGTGNNVAIAGVVLSGASSNMPKTLAVQGLGPSLESSGLTGTLSDPRLSFRGADGAEGLLTTVNCGNISSNNDNWQYVGTCQGNYSYAGSAVAPFVPTNPMESMIALNYYQNAASIVLSGTGNAVGTGLIAINEVDPTQAPQILNLSTRAFVGTGDNAMIAGFIVRGASPHAHKLSMKP
jgi:hypothetical protein